jgi:hypothetical protein
MSDEKRRTTPAVTWLGGGGAPQRGGRQGRPRRLRAAVRCVPFLLPSHSRLRGWAPLTQASYRSTADAETRAAPTLIDVLFELYRELPARAETSAFGQRCGRARSRRHSWSTQAKAGFGFFLPPPPEHNAVHCCHCRRPHNVEEFLAGVPANPDTVHAQLGLPFKARLIRVGTVHPQHRLVDSIKIFYTARNVQ